MFIPSVEDFCVSARPGRASVLIKRSPFWADPFAVYHAGRTRAPRVLLESARGHEKTGRYSVLAERPALVFESRDGRTTIRSAGGTRTTDRPALPLLRKLCRQGQAADRPGFPPFAGGAIGYFAYETKGLFEPFLKERFEKPGPAVPDIYFLFFDQGMVFDHEKRETIFFRHFRPGKDLAASYRREAATLDRAEAAARSRSTGDPGVRERTGLVKEKGIRASMDKRAFARTVRAAQSYIREGEIFQANLSHCLSFPLERSAEEIYSTLRRLNPSCFFGLLDAGRFQILSGSPERLVKLEGRSLATRPIAGTRPRKKDAAEDAAMAIELLLSEKERAEHIMLVDLERNDLGRVAEYGSVTVDELMTVEDYSHVKHIVSNARATLREGLDAFDILRSFFPGGTITGAPKIRCMEIIDELETVRRGPYTGSLGYIGFTGNMDFNIIIRSLVIERGMAHLNVGAGIVADSDPEKEYDETLYKAEAVLRAVFGEEPASRFLVSCGITPRAPR